jgi:hypothetical protein
VDAVSVTKRTQYAKEHVPPQLHNPKYARIEIDELINDIMDTIAEDIDFVRKAVSVLLGTVIASYSSMSQINFTI